MSLTAANIRNGARALLIASLLLGIGLTPADGQTVTRETAGPAQLKPLPMHVGGRVERQPDGTFLRQWPGTYFETAIRGSSVLFKVGTGDVSLRVSADGGSPVALVKPEPGLYRIGDLGPGVHRLRIQVANESQSGPTGFGGFFVEPGASAAPIPTRTRQIEFIGDSHTVGYGNTSPKRQCTEDEIWATTDTTLGVPARTAAHYGADYQVNAISGRGIVRNYNGFAADPLPVVYPFVLFDKAQSYADPSWHPQLIVISLGTNDFSTPLNPGEKWTSREQLQSDYEGSFVRFLSGVHQRNPNARFVLWAANPSDEISSEIRKVIAKANAVGIAGIDFVPVPGLEMTGCDWHPSTADDAAIAAALEHDIDSQATRWTNERKGQRG